MTLEVTGAWMVAHDFAFVHAGAERVTRLLARRVLDDSPVLALLGTPSILAELSGPGGRFLLPEVMGTKAARRTLVPIYPTALRRVPPVAGDLLASSYAFSHHVRAAGRKVVYCHSPLRQIWSGYDTYLHHMPRYQRALVPPIFQHLQRRDREAARSADAYIAASSVVAARIRRYYDIDPVAIIQPPVDHQFLDPPLEDEDDYLLWVGRITEPYKRLSTVIDAFSQLPTRLVVVGDGPDRARLQARATGNVDFVGWKSGEDLSRLYRCARGVIFPSQDDFGIVPLEAMASGSPVLAYASGGAADTVVEGLTGLFFHEQSPEAVREAVRRLSQVEWDRGAIREYSRRFDEDHFVRSVRAVLASV